MARRAWLLPGRRQALLLAALILAAAASLLLLPDRSSSYRAVATAVPPEGAPACVRSAPEATAGEPLRERVAVRSRVPLRDVARSTEVLPTPAGAVLSVAFEADTAYAAQRGASSTVSLSVSDACAEETSRLLLAQARAEERLTAAEEALRAAVVPPADPDALPPPPPPLLVAQRDEAAAELGAAAEAFERHSAVPVRSTTVTAAEPLGSERSGLEELAVPAGAAVCAGLALAVLRAGWRRAAGPVPA